MPRASLSVPKIRQELAWVAQEPDPNRCGCRGDVRRGKEREHSAGACTAAPTTKLWTFRWEYFCLECREYQWNGSRVADDRGDVGLGVGPRRTLPFYTVGLLQTLSEIRRIPGCQLLRVRQLLPS